MKFKLWLDASNLHTGGIINSAASFIDELASGEHLDQLILFDSIRATVSSEVRASLRRSPDVSIRKLEMTVLDTTPGIRYSRPTPQPDTLRIILSGPEYAGRQATVEICGFHDAFILGPSAQNLANSSPPNALRRMYQRQILRRYDAYFTETLSMAAHLRAFQPEKPTAIIPNGPSGVFQRPETWEAIDTPRREQDELRLFYPARGYQHKNHRFLPKVAHAFEHITGRRLRFITTLRNDEMALLGLTKERSIQNVGEVRVQHLPHLYLSSDGVFIPSLNEVASATPLEGLVMGRPVFASDRPFFRENFADALEYFDPYQCEETAQVIDRFYSLAEDERAERMAQGSRLVDALPTQKERFEALVAYAISVLDRCS